MKLNKRLSSYPILINDDDDYVDSYFEVSLNQFIEFDMLKINVKFTLENEGLKELIKNGLAKYVVNFECPLLSYREVKLSDNNYIDHSINLNNISGNLEISSFIVATQNIDKYYNEKFNWVYGKSGIDIRKGNYLAIGATYIIDVDRKNEGLKKLTDIIVIQQNENDQAEVSVQLDSDIIKILVSKEIKNKYFNYGKLYLYNLISMLMIPSMIYILTNMKNNPDLNSFRWYKVIENILRQEDIEISNLSEFESTGKNSIFQLAQKIFKSPIEKGIDELTAHEGKE